MLHSVDQSVTETRSSEFAFFSLTYEQKFQQYLIG